jgi:hypothetical protein
MAIPAWLLHLDAIMTGAAYGLNLDRTEGDRVRYPHALKGSAAKLSAQQVGRASSAGPSPGTRKLRKERPSGSFDFAKRRGA